MKNNQNTFWTNEEGTPKFGRIFGLIAGGALSIVGLARGFTAVPAGNVGVLSRFGQVQKEELQPGFNLKNPLDSVVKMTTRTREVKESLEVPSKDGLVSGLDVSVLYHLEPENANEVYNKLGDDDTYQTNIIQPLIRGTVRDVVANYKAEDLYTSNRTKAGQDMATILEKSFKERGLYLEQVLIRDLRLPATLKNSIEEKLSSEQTALKMQYVIQKEEQEAKRKVIEANGIAEAQKIIANGLTQEYLQWKYVESLKELVNSPNNTVIIMPYDQKLTPLLQVPAHK